MGVLVGVRDHQDGPLEGFLELDPLALANGLMGIRHQLNLLESKTNGGSRQDVMEIGLKVFSHHAGDDSWRREHGILQVGVQLLHNLSGVLVPISVIKQGKGEFANVT